MLLTEQKTAIEAISTIMGTEPVRAPIPMEALRRHGRRVPRRKDDDFDFSANLHFPTREGYLAFVHEWKSEYAGIVQEIRTAKAVNNRGLRENLRIVARLLLSLRAAGKAEARLSYARTHAEHGA